MSNFRTRILLIGLLGETLLGLAGVAWIMTRRLPLEWGNPLTGISVGLIVAGLLAAANLYLLLKAPPLPPVEALRRFYDDVLVPVFSRFTMLDIILISVAAGLGEELFFRGALQAEWGLVPAGVLFGAAHVGSKAMLVFGVWAGLLGLILGAVRQSTGGLLAPIIAHAAYDALALMYIRRAAHNQAAE